MFKVVAISKSVFLADWLLLVDVQLDPGLWAIAIGLLGWRQLRGVGADTASGGGRSMPDYVAG